MKAKKLAYFKNNKNYKHPYVAWLFNTPVTYATFTAVAVSAIGYSFVDAHHTVNDIQKPYMQNSPYQNVSIKNSPAITWAQNFVKVPLTGENNWNVSKTITPAQPVDFKECSAFGLLSPNVTSTSGGENSNYSVTAQTYAPGTAPQEFNNYIKSYEKCWTTTSDTYGTIKTKVVKYDNGFFFTYGDAIIFVNNKNKIDQEELINYYVNRAKETLEASQCKSLNVSVNDIKRNYYYNTKNYTGLIKSQTVNTKVSLSNIPTPVYASVKEEGYMDAPEGPLDPSLPKIPANKPISPVIPDNPDNSKPPMSQNISYQITDPIGPGCGWAWSGQKQPLEDTQELKAKQTTEYEEAQAIVDSNARNYIDTKIDFSRRFLELMPQINAWNSYVNQVDNVYAKWTWLNNQRELIKTDWYNYVEQHDYWTNFDNNQANAVTKYNKAVDACNNANKSVSDWDKTWGELYKQQQEQSASATPTPSATNTPSASSTDAPSATPSSSTSASTTSPTTAPSSPSAASTANTTVNIPPRPQGCDVAPQKDAILTETKPAEPQAPTLEKGVTIPSSWPQPIKESNVSLEK